MADIKAKIVRTLAPAGVAANFMGITGNSHHYYPVEITLIEKMIKRGVLVYELLAEESENGETEVLLTLENFDQDNSGKQLEENIAIVPDLELAIANTHAEEKEAFLEEKGKEIKDKQTETYNDFFDIEEEESTSDDDFDEVTREEIFSLFNIDEETYNTIENELAAEGANKAEVLQSHGMTEEDYNNLKDMLSNASE